MNGLDLKMATPVARTLPAMAMQSTGLAGLATNADQKSSAAQATATTGSKGGTGEQAKMAKAAQQFEAVFLRQLISSMRSASLGDDILGNSAGDQFRDMSDARLADSMAEKSTIGIAEMLLAQFNRKDSDKTAVTRAVGNVQQAPVAEALVSKGDNL